MVGLYLISLSFYLKNRVRSLISPQAFEATRIWQFQQICQLARQLGDKNPTVFTWPCAFHRLARRMIWDQVLSFWPNLHGILSFCPGPTSRLWCVSCPTKLVGLKIHGILDGFLHVENNHHKANNNKTMIQNNLSLFI